jgi:phosphatidate cytidylyltransferase
MGKKKRVKKMKQRVITAVFLILIVGLLIYLDRFYLTWSFLGVIYLFGLNEANNLFKIKTRDKFTVLGFGILAWFIPILPVEPILSVLLILLIISSKIAYSPETNKKIILPFIYPTVSFIIFFELYEIFGMNVLIWLILTVSVTDTMAYFVGKTIGKRKFSITSPNKTLEGVLGGVLFGTIFGSLFFDLLFSDFNIFKAILVTFAVSVASVFGDLFESYLKRQANVKDSGNILPGHGGILDRLDGFLFAVIVLYSFEKLI